MTKQREKKPITGIVLLALSLVCTALFATFEVLIDQPFSLPEDVGEATGALGIIAAVWVFGYGFLWISPLLLLSGISFAIGAAILSEGRLRKLMGCGSISLNLGLLIHFFVAYGHLWLRLFQ